MLTRSVFIYMYIKFIDYLKNIINEDKKLSIADELGLIDSDDIKSNGDETSVSVDELEKARERAKSDNNKNSAATIKKVLDSCGLGLEKIRLTKTKENTSAVVYKENGFSIDAVWIAEDGPMSGEGYSEQDGKNKLNSIIDGFIDQGGELIKRGTIKENSESKIKFGSDFTILISPIILNSAEDGSGFDRTFLKIESIN